MGGVSQVVPRARADRPRLTGFHQRIAAEALTARGGAGASGLAPALAHSAVDLNPHQIEAAAFALAAARRPGARSSPTRSGSGRPSRRGSSSRSSPPTGRGARSSSSPPRSAPSGATSSPASSGSSRDVVDGDSVRAAERNGLKTNPFDTGGIVIASHPFAAMRAAEVERVPWDVAVIDEAHRLRNAYRRDHRTGQALRKALRALPEAAPHRDAAPERPHGAARARRLHRRRAARERGGLPAPVRLGRARPRTRRPTSRRASRRWWSGPCAGR